MGLSMIWMRSKKRYTITMEIKHKPNYLIITWGSLSFRCFLTSMDVEYKLFKPDGTPLRAMVKATFKRFIEAEERVAEENNNSPDLTHYRVRKSRRYASLDDTIESMEILSTISRSQE